MIPAGSLPGAFMLALLVGQPVLAQAPRSVPRLAILGPQDAQSLAVQMLRQGLRELGYQEGQNLLIDERHAEDRIERLPELATELVGLKPDVIFTMSTPGVLAAKRATATIPIVAIAGLVGRTRVIQNMARPEGNVTGLNLMQLTPKLLQLLKEAAPQTTRVAILVNPANPGWDRYEETLDEAGRTLGLQLFRVEVRESKDLDAVFTAMVRSGANALLVVNDSAFFASRQRIADLATRHRLATASDLRGFAGAGGLIGFGQRPETLRRLAVYVDRILKGARPGDLPVEQADTFTLVVNLKTAKALGLTVPPALLARADEVIQ